MNTLARLKEIIYENSGTDPEFITEESTIVTDLELNSLDKVELTIAIEEEWDIRVADPDTDGWETVADVLKTIEGKIGV